jgi:ubiquinone/menaquinone biosynthesis C-methylase UbiE
VAFSIYGRNHPSKGNEYVKTILPDLKEGEVVADIGAGSGYFAWRFTHHVGDKGKVFAVDINPDMILYMNRRFREMQLKNIVTVLAAPDDPFFMDASIDRFFFCDTWHHIENKRQYLTLMKKMLKPGGQVIMIEFHKKELTVGPPISRTLAQSKFLFIQGSAYIRPTP